MACLERNLHIQIFSGEAILNTIGRDLIVDLLLCYMTHYDLTMDNDIVRDINCDIIMGHHIDVCTYAHHDITMHTDVARMLIYYVLQCPIMILLFS